MITASPCIGNVVPILETGMMSPDCLRHNKQVIDRKFFIQRQCEKRRGGGMFRPLASIQVLLKKLLRFRTIMSQNG